MGCDGTDSVVSDWSVIHFSMYAEIVKYSGKYFGSLPVVLSEPRIAYLLYIKICDIFIYNILLCIGGKTDLCKMLFDTLNTCVMLGLDPSICLCDKK